MPSRNTHVDVDACARQSCIVIIHVGIAYKVATRFVDIDNCPPRTSTGVSPEPLTAQGLPPSIFQFRRVACSAGPIERGGPATLAANLFRTRPCDWHLLASFWRAL